jgi:MFS family permease
MFAALLLLFGRVADLVGARRVFVLGAVVFGVTSLTTTILPTAPARASELRRRAHGAARAVRASDAARARASGRPTISVQ